MKTSNNESSNTDNNTIKPAAIIQLVVLAALLFSLSLNATASEAINMSHSLGGESLIWGPVATTIVWGLAFVSPLTLFAIPLLFRLFVSEPGQHH